MGSETETVFDPSDWAKGSDGAFGTKMQAIGAKVENDFSFIGNHFY